MNIGGRINTFSHSATSVGSDWVSMISFTDVRNHYDDGTGECYYEGVVNAPSGTALAGTVVSGNKIVTLDTIPRKSEVSLSKTTFNIGETVTVKVSRKSTSFTHTIRVVIGSLSKTLATNVGESWNWSTNANQDLYGQVYNVASKSGTIYCDCYSGSTLIGTSSVGFTANAVKSSITSNANWTAGNTLTVNISRPSAKYTHKVEIFVNGTSVATTTGVGTSATFNTTAFHTNVFKALAQTGSKSTSIKMTTYNGSAEIGNQTITGTVTAPAASTSSIANFNIGDTKTITITRANSAFTHKIEVYWGDWKKTIASNAGTSTTWNTSTDASTMYSKIPNATSGVGGIRTTTYYNGVQVRDYTSKNFTAYVVNSNPTFTAFTYKDNNSTTSSVTGNNQLQIQNKSSLVVTVTPATAKNSATIKKYIATINGKNYESTSTTITIGSINKAGTLALQVKAVDSRGLTSTVSKNITVVSYTQPNYTVSVTRKNNYEEETTYNITTGRYDLIPINGSNKNAIQLAQYRYKQSGGSYGNWTSIALTKSGANYSYSVLIGNLDNTKTYIFQTQIADKLTTITQEFTLKNGTPVMAMRKQSIGINKVPTISKGIEIDGDISFTNYEDKIVMKGSEADSRTLQIKQGDIHYNVNPSAGWANGLRFNTNDGQTLLGMLGAFGNKNALTYFYVGGTYDNPLLKIDTSGNGLIKKSIMIPKNGTQGYGLCNSDGASIIRDFNNKNVTVDATGGQLYLGYENTTGVNMFNGKVSVDSSGNITAPAFKGNATSATKATQDGNGTTIVTNYAKAQSNSNNTGFNRVASGNELQRSGFYTITNTSGVWYNLINLRHRNGEGDGTTYGMQIVDPLNQNGTRPQLQVRKHVQGAWGTWHSIFSAINLYNNTSGTTGTVTLSATSANYSILEIFYGKTGSNHMHSVRVHAPNGKKVSLSINTHYATDSLTQASSKLVQISGTSISAVANYYGGANIYPSTISNFNTNEIYIYKVIGYIG